MVRETLHFNLLCHVIFTKVTQYIQINSQVSVKELSCIGITNKNPDFLPIFFNFTMPLQTIKARAGLKT